MDFLIDSYKRTGNLHHAYALVGDRAPLLAELREFIEKGLKVPTRGNPDFWQQECDSFGIDEGKLLKEMQQNRAAGRKIFVLAANSLTREAQNSLLKVFEEPTDGTHFFLVIPARDVLLPTLQSRFAILEGASAKTGSKSAAAEGSANAWAQKASEFLAAAPAKRLLIAKDFAEEISEGDRTKADAIALLGEIERALHAVHASAAKPFPPVVAAAFDELIRCRSYLGDRSSNAKMILEHLALALPQA